MPDTVLILVDAGRLDGARALDLLVIATNRSSPASLLSIIALGAGGGVLLPAQSIESVRELFWPTTLGAPDGTEVTDVLNAVYEIIHSTGGGKREIAVLPLIDWAAFPDLEQELNDVPGIHILKHPLTRMSVPTPAAASTAPPLGKRVPATTVKPMRTTTMTKTAPATPAKTTTPSKFKPGCLLQLFILTVVITGLILLANFLVGLVHNAKSEPSGTPTPTVSVSHEDELRNLVMGSPDATCIAVLWTAPETGDFAVATKPEAVGCDVQGAAVQIVSHAKLSSIKKCPVSELSWTSSSMLACTTVLYRVGACFPGNSDGSIFDAVISCFSQPNKKFPQVLRVTASVPSGTAECAAGDNRYSLGVSKDITVCASTYKQ